MITLGLGVIDVPEPEGGSTYATGLELEKVYGLFSLMANHYAKEIADLVGQDAAIGLEMMEKGQTVEIPKVFAVSSEGISRLMHTFITSQEVERVAASYGERGIPTQAALDGRSYRFEKGVTAKRWVKKGLRGAGKEVTKRAARPSFIYSGVFEASLKAEIK